MHATELLPIAALVADNGTAFVHAPLPTASPSLHQYWSASRNRLDLWSQAFNKGQSEPTRQECFSLCGVIEEVLLSEVLTRVWAAATTTHDLHHQRQLAGPVARSIHLGHLDARRRALTAIVKLHGLREREARRLNLLRQKCERWTDMFLAYFPLHGEIEKLAFDPRRCKEFAIDMHHEESHRDTTSTLTLASLEAMARSAAQASAVNGTLNGEIAAAVLGCLPADAFEMAAVGATLWQCRLDSTTSETMDLVAQLLSLECPADTYSSAVSANVS